MRTRRDPIAVGGRPKAVGASPASSTGRRGPRAVVPFVLAALLTLVPFGSGGQDAALAATATTWEVQVGGDDRANLLMTMAYFPDTLSVHVGDTVAWKFASFHTVTFNAGKDPLPLFIPGPNPGELAVGPGGFPSGP